MAEARRRVRIQWVVDSWLVFYVDRQKHQRYTAGQFYGEGHTRQAVVEWIKEHGYELVEQE